MPGGGSQLHDFIIFVKHEYLITSTQNTLSRIHCDLLHLFIL